MCTNTPTTCCGDIFKVQNVEITYLTLTTPFSVMIFIGRVELAMVNLYTKFKVSRCTRYEAMNGGANAENGVGLGWLGALKIWAMSPFDGAHRIGFYS